VCLRARARARHLLHPQLHPVENRCRSSENSVCVCSSGCYRCCLIVQYVCSEEVIPSYHTAVTCTCTCTCTTFAFLAHPTTCTFTHALHSPTPLVPLCIRLPQVYAHTRDESRVDERLHTSFILWDECMGSPILLSYTSSRWDVPLCPASSVRYVTADHSSHGMLYRVVHHVGSHTTTHHHHHITSSLYTSLCRSYHITFSVATDSYHLTCDTTDPGGRTGIREPGTPGPFTTAAVPMGRPTCLGPWILLTRHLQE
jgi:hypothetical protein